MIDRISRTPWMLVLAFIASGLLGAGLFAAAQAMVPGANPDRERIEGIVKAYILDHPEILPEAMNRLQAKEAAEQQRASNTALKSHAEVVKPYAGAWGGNPNGDVTVVAFMDYNCGYCRASLPTLARLIAEDPGVRIVYREYPVLGDESTEAARWALAAADQGKFMPFHEALYAGAGFDQAAAKAGLDVGAARAALRSPRISGEIAANRKTGYDLRLTGTPGFVIGKQVFHGAMEYEAFVKAVAAARAGK
ncbi:DsbA family protein [Sphingomonas sp. LB-2]|uniref:DsbA family protein n=1 Tax=Sphingomonas caeni TaxID=2984949 RepID=UPI00222E1DBF|nr:DsbA family protein [Sphingomonas caeni]MCW3847104.1 DsbA family protein [Sphingomonas caeni]